MAVTRPAAGSAPEAIAMARLSGNATIATVTPAKTSAANSGQLYVFRVVSSFGVTVAGGRGRWASVLSSNLP